MLFNSLEFAIFFPLVAALYFTLPHRFRTLMLLLASCVFYMAFIPAYIVILAVTILIDYTAGIYLAKTVGPSRRYLLIMSIIATCLVLAVFKYFYFVTGNAVAIAGFFGLRLTGPSINIILPIGLSFHTFQSLSYVVEVYRGRQKVETNFIVYATYVMFFPQLVAGPIERPQNLLHQFREPHSLDWDRVASGLKRMAWGFFKKLVVADRLSLYANDVFNSPQQYGGLHFVLGTFFFAYQIYCDFSGYSDIAIGSARVLGFKLMENFDTPYASLSVAEFWKRWHISLSTWFRDYVYVPLGGNRVSRGRWMANIFVTFGLSGLWHGASWTYVLWGLLNGFYLVFGTLTSEFRNRVFVLVGVLRGSLARRISMLVSTFALTCLAWVFFRARSFTDAVYILSHAFSDWNTSALSTEHFLLRYLPLAFLAIGVLEFGQWARKHGAHSQMLSLVPAPVRLFGYAAFTIMVIMFGVYTRQPFIYFQF